MKRCPSCNRTFTDVSLNFCLEDGTPLIHDTGLDPGATLRYTESRETHPPVTEIYPSTPPQTQRAPVRYETPPARNAQPDQWSPLPPMPPQKKSNAVWWILGGILVAGVVVVGVAVMLLALASMGSNNNANNRNANTRAANRNSNANNANGSNVNAIATLPSLTTDDFSEETWGKGTFSYGDISYEDGEYRMRAKENSYLVMYAPSNNYSTENARTSVSVQDVDGGAVSSGYGLIVHGQKTATSQLEDYALLIFTGAQPQYEIIKHKAGVQTTVVPWTKSSAINTGTGSNKLEVRARGPELSFYINGQYVNRISDSEIKKGVAGFYTSGTSEVAFDDLEIRR
ncbi:MAG TPA: hypothetical protein VNO50_00535 [Pyrinomonadaceae bacterium]|nr:hypothetical protein [Pyrinomonadaceae bacterium]